MNAIVRVAAVIGCFLVFTTTTDAQLRFGKLGVGAVGSMILPTIDNAPTTGPTNPSGGLAGGLSVAYSPWLYVGLKASAGIGDFTYTYATLPAKTTIAMLNGYATVNLMPNGSFNPFVGVGAGYHYFDARYKNGTAIVNSSASPSGFDILLHGGFDVFFGEFFSVTASGDYGLMQTDLIDGRKSGGNDSYIRAGLEVRYYFFDQAFLTRMLEALKARYER